MTDDRTKDELTFGWSLRVAAGSIILSVCVTILGLYKLLKWAGWL